MERAPRVGLIPLYLELYDRSLPALRGEQEAFLTQVAGSLRAAGLEVAAAPICCVRPAVEAALRSFERERPDLLVTLHLAYSPSLEAADVLAGQDLPVLLLDITPDDDFGPGVDPLRLLRDHGIHGVQDLASVLRRRGKPYRVVAGPASSPAVYRRTAEHARAARAAAAFRSLRVLRIGRPFEGMGDFQVDERALRARFGIEVEEIRAADLRWDAEAVEEDRIDAEMALDRDRFEVGAPEDVHRRTTRVGLGLRRFLEGGRFGAFSMSFLAFHEPEGVISTVPFLEASKAMARGIGYAGEGDVLTASLVGALAAGFGSTTFTEMFCPDWTGGSVFLSHMGEFNPEVAAGKPRLYEKEFPFTPARNPACLACAPRPGAWTFVNLAPGPEDSLRLIAAPVEVLGDGTHPGYRDWIRGWMRPRVPVDRFLEEFSRLGGTHHSALVLGDRLEGIEAFAAHLGIECLAIDQGLATGRGASSGCGDGGAAG
jgi:L-arabinose isomerase